MKTSELTVEEIKAIKDFKRLASSWPKTLWLFANSGGISIMKVGKDGKKVTLPDYGFDPAYEIDKVFINSDGGDW